MSRKPPIEARALPGALDPLLEQIEKEKLSGVVVLTRGSVQKRLFVRDGEIVFASSTDPRELIGQSLLKQGLINEKDLREALAASRAAGPGGGEGPRLATALIAAGKVTPLQCATVFQEKIQESVLDLFLWESGAVEFTPGPVDPEDAPFPLLLQMDGIRRVGEKRRVRMKAVRAVLPAQDMGFARTGPWPAGFPNTQGDARLAALVEKGLTLEKIVVELRGQEYAVCVRLAQLMKSGTLTPATHARGFEHIGEDERTPSAGIDTKKGGVSEVPAGQFTKFGPLPGGIPPAPPAEPLAPPKKELEGAALREIAAARLAEGKIEEAQVLLMEVIAADPLEAGDAWEMLQQVEAAIVAKARKMGLTDDIRLALTGPVGELTGKMFASSETFVLSRLAAGPMTIGELIAVSPFQPHEVLQILDRLVKAMVLTRVL